MAKRSAKVEEIKGLTRGLPDGAIEAVGIEPLRDLHRQFGTLKDARFQPFVDHLLSDILMIALIAVMAEHVTERRAGGANGTRATGTR